MNIVILGAGRVGGEIAKMLSGECDITLVDSRRARLLEMQSSYDLRTVAGSASDPEVLRRAGCADADVIVAVTAIDEVNLVACKLCGAISGGAQKIARIRGRAADEKSILGPDGFGIDHVFCPEQIVADDIIAAVKHPGCDSVHSFADGRANLISLKVRADTPSAGTEIRELRRGAPQADFRFVAVRRGTETIQPLPDTRLAVGDEVFVVVDADNVDEAASALTGESRQNRHVFLAGGGNVGTARRDGFGKRAGCEDCGSEPRVVPRVVAGAGADDGFERTRHGGKTCWRRRASGETDIFCAVTNDDEENIMAAMLAKRLGARRVAALVNRDAYVDILETLIDAVISPSRLTIGAVLPHVRRRDVGAVHSFRRGAEALEATVHGDGETSAVVGRRADEIKWPKDVTLGAVVRGDEFLIARHDIVVLDGDRLILFANGKDAINGVEKLLKVGLNYF